MRKLLLFVVTGVVLSACTPKGNTFAPDSWEQERVRRVALDFPLNREDVAKYINQYLPDVSDSQWAEWEQCGALECMDINGEKRYFRNAAPNLFRIDSAACNAKLVKDGYTPKRYEVVNREHLPRVMAAVRKEKTPNVLPTRMKVRYTLTVDSGAVPAGKMIRCWLPFPRKDVKRQQDVKLLATSEPNYLLSPDSCLHSSLYMEKPAERGAATVFSAEYEYTSYAAWYNLKPEDVKPYDTSSELYRTYTAERMPHIMFSSRIQTLARKLVGDETNPLLRVRKIFQWVNDHFPWASAREYSTIENIPEYVLDNRHGDCGQVSLLFITLARSVGIPAKWQSGFMMHPGGRSLHDWAEVYFEGVGWVPVDQSFGVPNSYRNEDEHWFFSNGIDAYRMIVNQDISAPFYPLKKHFRSETVDFQRGEVEWEGGNLYFNQWQYDMEIDYQCM